MDVENRKYGETALMLSHLRSIKNPVVYKTPGVQCQHADWGCCPQCRNPKSGSHPHGYARSPLKESVSSLSVKSSGLNSVAGRRLVFNLTGSSA